MQIYTRHIGEEDLRFALRNHCDPDTSVFLDIETTGLNAAYESIYLIGCAAHGPQGWTLTQWFDDTGRGEADLLNSFLIYIRSCSTLIHYNGQQFDLPFLTRRIEKLCPEGSLAVLEEKKSVDLFVLIRPFKKVLGLESLRQQVVEQYLDTAREEAKSGGELTKVYAEFLKPRQHQGYVGQGAQGASAGNAGQVGAGAFAGNAGQGAQAASPADNAGEMLQMLLEHNAADVSGLLKIAHLLSLQDVLSAKLKVHRAQASRYKDAEGKDKEEIVMQCSLQELPEEAIYRKLTAAADECYLSGQGNRITIKVPLVTGERKYFYANYKDYYYLPAQDQALHKSIASFVEKDHREQAKAENCYTRKSGTFLPEWDLFRTPFFKENYHDKLLLFEFTQQMKSDQQFFSDYATYIFRHLTGQ